MDNVTAKRYADEKFSALEIMSGSKDDNEEKVIFMAKAIDEDGYIKLLVCMAELDEMTSEQQNMLAQMECAMRHFGEDK